MPLEEAIRRRRSRPEFSTVPLPLTALAALFQLGCGVTAVDDVPRRAAPSGGALFPVEAYALAFDVDGLACGAYHYLPLEHALEHLFPLPAIEVAASFLPPGLFFARPALILALSVVFDRIQRKYLERGYRFALLEAGHIAQNVLLAACALSINAVPVGGFWDEPFNEVLRFNPIEEAVVYALLAGHPPAEVPGAK
jgi:SagB-type dehydrogenase family enzyme